MGLLDQLTGMLGNGDQDGGETLKYKAILSWIEQQGGFQGLLEKFQQGGLANVVESWLSGGTNLPIHPAKIVAALGLPAIQQLAQKLNMNEDGASELLAEYLPKIVDVMSPEGKLDAGNNSLLTAGLNILKGKLFS